MFRHCLVLSLGLLGTACVGVCFGQEPCGTCGPPIHIRRFAQPSDTGRYYGYYVGGGTASRGEPRRLDEGTWGWDYAGLGVLPHRVFLQWTHGSRYQGGTGAYKTDGPPVRDILSFPHSHPVGQGP